MYELVPHLKDKKYKSILNCYRFLEMHHYSFRRSTHVDNYCQISININIPPNYTVAKRIRRVLLQEHKDKKNVVLVYY